MMKIEIYTDENNIQRVKNKNLSCNMKACCTETRVEIDNLKDGVYDFEYFEIKNYSSFTAARHNRYTCLFDTNILVLTEEGEKKFFQSVALSSAS